MVSSELTYLYYFHLEILIELPSILLRIMAMATDPVRKKPTPAIIAKHRWRTQYSIIGGFLPTPQMLYRRLDTVTVPVMAGTQVVASVVVHTLRGTLLEYSDHVIYRIQLGSMQEGVIVKGARQHRHRPSAFR